MTTDSERLKLALEAVAIPRDGRNYSVVEYFQLSADLRGNDEADVVDMRLARVLLGFLGYDSQRDWEYNLNKAGGRPDFLIVPDGRIAFYLENKNTSTSLILAQLDSQLRRYAESLTGLGLAFNGREVLATRLNAGRLSPVLRVEARQRKPFHSDLLTRRSGGRDTPWESQDRSTPAASVWGKLMV